MTNRLDDAFENTGNALARLGEALEQSAANPDDMLAIDGTIQRFEFCVELMWKLLQKILKSEEVEGTLTPKEVMIQAYRFELIDDETYWLEMLKDRNLTSHTYKQSLALEIYSRLEEYHRVMHKTYETLKAQYN